MKGILPCLLGVLPVATIGCGDASPDRSDDTLVSESVQDSVRFRRVLIDPDLGGNAIFVATADLTGDGRKDLVAGPWVYVSPAAAGAPWLREPIGEPVHNMAGLLDVDGDGDLDILGVTARSEGAGARFVLAENTGGRPFVLHAGVAEGAGASLHGIAGGVFQADGPVEIALSWNEPDRGVEMLTLPADPLSEPWSTRRISLASAGGDLSAGDVDGDGDLDLFLGTRWLENPGTDADDWQAHEIGETTNGRADRNDLADFDADGDLDAVVGLEDGADLLLFLAPDDPRAPWTRTVLATGLAGGSSMDTGDIDADGDPDVVVGEHRGEASNRVLVYLNDGTAASFIEVEIDRRPASVIDHHNGTQLVDVDGDGDLDIISVGWTNPKVWVYEQLSRP